MRRFVRWLPRADSDMRVAVVVLGDLGRSPRMLYHAQALAAHGVAVDLVGFAESTLPDVIRRDPRIAIHAVGTSPGSSPPASARTVYLIAAVWRGIGLLAGLTRLLLWGLTRPDVILVQNPPGVPVLLVAWAAARVRSARFWIDWHNLTSSMLSLRLGAGHALVGFVAWYEGVVGRRADGHLFVSAAMAEALAARWRISGLIFRDRPAEQFRPLDAAERERTRQSVFTRLGLPAGAAPVFAISPTSWTADEDFDLLIEAVAVCEALADDQQRPGRPFPTLLILITGRGPLRKRFEERVAGRPGSQVHLCTMWLDPGEYPRVLAAADLGLCLHRSASGLDLPMKVADMFGVGLPVCAFDYGPCLQELVRHRDNGLLVTTAPALGRQLYEFVSLPADDRALATLRLGAARAGSDRWQEAWHREVWSRLTESVGGRQSAPD
jgi:beta-1,4-mannosyltransferase